MNKNTINHIKDIELNISIIFGEKLICLDEIKQLRKGSVIQFENEPGDLFKAEISGYVGSNIKKKIFKGQIEVDDESSFMYKIKEMI